jgi:hypothetical protein
MTSINTAALVASIKPEVQVALMAIRKAVSSSEGDVTPAVETQLQNSIHTLRSTSPYSEAVAALEAVAVNLRVLAKAKQEGRCNLYTSQLMRLRKQISAC